MLTPPPIIHVLVSDAVAALDQVLADVERNRDALVVPHKTRDDLIVATLDPVTGAPTTRRYPATLGPPADLGLRECPDPLPGLMRRIVAAAGSDAGLRELQRSIAKFDHLLTLYQGGRFSGLRPAEWQKQVEDLVAEIREAAMEARAGLETWEKQVALEQPLCPDSSLLKEQEFVFVEHVVAMFHGKLGVDAARKMISSGRLGPPVRVGKRLAVRLKRMREYLDAKAESGGKKSVAPGKAASLPVIPRRRRGARSKPKT